MGIKPLKSKENFRTYFWVFLFSSCFPVFITEEEATHLLSVEISYTVPEVGGKRFTPQNDGERLLYTLVGPKMSNFEVNMTISIDM